MNTKSGICAGQTQDQDLSCFYDLRQQCMDQALANGDESFVKALECNIYANIMCQIQKSVNDQLGGMGM